MRAIQIVEMGLSERGKRVVDAFREKCGSEPQAIASAPGRINLIGGHTDYNEGYVLPVTVDRRIWVAGARRSDRNVSLSSVNLSSKVTFSLDLLEKTGDWTDYPKGVIHQFLQSEMRLEGFNATYWGDLPMGAGLSSSAAIETATAFLLRYLSRFSTTPERLATICWRAETDFVGMKCGIMDQFISALGRRDTALFLDCRTLDYKHISLPLEDYEIVVCDSKVRRQLVDSEYNTRRGQCEEGVRLLSARISGIKALRDLSTEQLEENMGLLPETVYRRCRHVVTENARVIEAAHALKEGDLARFGDLLNASYRSLRDDYEVSCPELDALMAAAMEMPGVLGSRITGAGFGGSTIHLVEKRKADEFEENIRTGYRNATGITAGTYRVRSDEGARVDFPSDEERD